MNLNPKGSSANTHHTYAPAKTNTLEGWPEVAGPDFDALMAKAAGKGAVDVAALLASYASTGFQATNLAQAVEIVQQMRKDKATIFLSCTSNIITSGLRDVVRWLVQHKHINALVMSAGGVEEDLIKTLKPFVIGSFEAAGKVLYEEGVNRSGNIFVPNDRYVSFEDFIDPILDELYERQQNAPDAKGKTPDAKGKAIDTSELCAELGRRIEKEAGKKCRESILWWAQKNDIPVFCPAITDGSFGDLVFFQKQRHPNFQIDITGDLFKIVKLCLNSDKTGAICLGGGTPKHYTLNAQLFRDGADYAVYVNTGAEFDGSDSGARPDEAISWGKIKAKGKAVKVTADATLVFPLIVAGGFA